MRTGQKIAFAAAALLSTSAATAQPYGSDRAFERYRLTAKGGGLGISIDETIVFSAVHQKGADRARYWIAERDHWDENWCGDHDPVSRKCVKRVTASHEWIDGRRYPQLLRDLIELPKLPPLTFVSPDDLSSSYMSEAPEINLTAAAVNAEGIGVSVTRHELQGPLVRWRIALAASLSGCWTTTPVVIGASS